MIRGYRLAQLVRVIAAMCETFGRADGVSHIADALGVDRRNTARRIGALRARGIVRVEYHGRGRGRRARIEIVRNE